jgi:hypothetical protein
MICPKCNGKKGGCLFCNGTREITPHKYQKYKAAEIKKGNVKFTKKTIPVKAKVNYNKGVSTIVTTVVSVVKSNEEIQKEKDKTDSNNSGGNSSGNANSGSNAGGNSGSNSNKDKDKDKKK